jgi:hypothetical protein
MLVDDTRVMYAEWVADVPHGVPPWGRVALSGRIHPYSSPCPVLQSSPQGSIRRTPMSVGADMQGIRTRTRGWIGRPGEVKAGSCPDSAGPLQCRAPGPAKRASRPPVVAVRPTPSAQGREVLGADFVHQDSQRPPPLVGPHFRTIHCAGELEIRATDFGYATRGCRIPQPVSRRTRRC